MTETSTHLSIGEVLGLLQQDFPDVTISKIRFLESQGLIDPERTPSGYRKFYDPDIERLRWILHQQRENFLPLKVIKERLESGGPLTDQPVEAEQPAPAAEVVETVGVGAAPVDTPYRATSVDDAPSPDRPTAGSVEDDGIVVDATDLVAQQGGAPWPNDPTMEFDFASLTENRAPDIAAEQADEAAVPPEPAAPPEVAAPAEDVAPVETEPTADDDPGLFEAPDELDALAAPSGDAVPSGDATPYREDDQPFGGDEPAGWGAADLDLALATPASTGSVDQVRDDGVDLDLVEIEVTEVEVTDVDVVAGGGADADGTTDVETGAEPVEGTTDRIDDAAASGSSVTDRLRRGDLAEPEPLPDAVTDIDDAEPAETSSELDSSAAPDDGPAEPRGRPAAERYFSADYREPMGAMAMNVEELASQSSLTVSQIRELEHFGIIVGESVGPDVVYTEESLAVARAAHTFLERGIEPRHLRPFAMAADRELSLYEQLALPVIRKRDPGTRTEADKLIASLYESGSDLRSLLVKRGIRNNFGR